MCNGLTKAAGTSVGLWGRILIGVCVLRTTVCSEMEVKSALGKMVTLTCPIHFEEDGPVPKLVVHWRNPNESLVCSFIKHKESSSCLPGYSFSYKTGSFSLTLERVSEVDIGTHICSVYKTTEHYDYNIHVNKETVTSTSAGTCQRLSCSTTFLAAVISLLSFM